MPTYQQNKEHIKRNHAQKDRLNVWVSKDLRLKEALQMHVARTGESMQGFIVRAIVETMERDRSPNAIMVDDTPPAIQAFLDEYKKAGE